MFALLKDFIEPEEGEDLFVHRKGISNSEGGLQAGQEVVFETEQGKKGLMAVHVKLKN